MSLKSLSDENIQKYIHRVLRTWHRPENHNNVLSSDPLLLQKGQAKIRGMIIEAIGALKIIDSQSATILRERFIHGNTILAVAHKLNLSPDQLNRRQRQAISKLTEIILEKERSLREEQLRDNKAQLLAPTYSTLFGLDTAREQLVAQLTSHTYPWVTSIVGIGGIGKTALADAVTRQTITKFQFNIIAWLRSRSDQESEKNLNAAVRQDFRLVLAETLLPADTPTAEKLTRLHQLIKSRTCLIVIDNLHDENEYKRAFEQIYPYLNPSKLLLTSRYVPINCPETLIYPLKELTLKDTCDLLSHHAQHVGINDQIDLICKNAPSIFQVVGGNPLAVKLVVGLLVSLPLSLVLNDFTRAKIEDIERLYRYIYFRAWQSLDENAKTVLVNMAQAPDVGTSIEGIRASTGLSEETTAKSIQALFSRSLIEPRGTIEERLYGIHRLTRSFLQTDIVPHTLKTDT